MQYLIILFFSLVVTILVTPHFIDLLNKIKIVDQPDGRRKLQDTPVPRLGGLLIFIALFTSIFIFYSDLNSIKYFLFGAIIIFTLGAYDDLIGAKWYLKFIYQLLASSMLMIMIVPQISTLKLFGIELSIIPSYIILMLFIVGTINSFNLLDGLDGLVAGFSLLVLSLLFFISLNFLNTFLLILSASIIGSLIGFLKYNSFPARIYLGDSGSLSLGYIVITAVLLISINHSTATLDLTFPIIILALPIADTVKVLIERLFSGRHPFLADRSHIHHIVSSKNITHKTTVFIIILYSILFGASGIYYMFYSQTEGIILFVILLLPLIFTNKLLNFALNQKYLLTVGRSVNRFPQFLLNYFKVGVIPVVTLFVAIYFLFILLNQNLPITNFILPSFLIIGLLIVFTLINYKKNKLLSDIIIFFNILIFFILNQADGIIYQDISYLPILGNLNYNLLSIGILLPVIGFYIIFRDRLRPQREALFTAFDLIIILLVILMSVSSNLLPVSKSYIISDTIFRSFLIYIFFKILIQLQPRFRIPLYSFSFLMVITAQIISLSV